jgi:aryl-alcohol dehydrogenase-like predicted oxidoreductase
MKFRKLGNTGFDVSLLGFGTWQIGGARWNALSDRQSVRLLQAARDLGVNIFDASIVYGQYEGKDGRLHSRSQELLGKAFLKTRDRVHFCVKLGQFDEYSHRSNYDPQRMVEQFHHALRALRTDYIDICLVHAPSLHEVKEGKALVVLQTLQAAGLIRAVGYSFESEPEHVYAALEQQVDVLMLQYNLIDRSCSLAIDKAKEHGVGILVGGPFKRGYLTGRYLSIEDLPDDDYWSWNLRYNSEKVEQILSKVQQFLKEHHSPQLLRRTALKFIADRDGIGSIIVGHRSVKEILENIQLLEHEEPPRANSPSHTATQKNVHELCCHEDKNDIDQVSLDVAVP